MKFIPLYLLIYLFETQYGFLNAQQLSLIEKGPIYDRQIYLVRNKTSTKISTFAPYETILNTSLSPNASHLVALHRANGSLQLALTIYNLSKIANSRTIYTDYGGNILWFQENRLIHTWGCGSPCTGLRVYDLNLDTILELGADDIFLDFLKGKAITLPVMLASQGSFLIYNLENGKLEKTVSLHSFLGRECLYSVSELRKIGEYLFNVRVRVFSGAIDSPPEERVLTISLY